MVNRRKIAQLVLFCLFLAIFYPALFIIFVGSIPLPFVGMAMVSSAIIIAFGTARFVFGVRWRFREP